MNRPEQGLHPRGDESGPSPSPDEPEREITGPDPWKHCAAGMKCDTCMWFVRKELPEGEGALSALGRCRRHAPTMNGYPAVFRTDWCGDHKLDETKI